MLFQFLTLRVWSCWWGGCSYVTSLPLKQCNPTYQKFRVWFSGWRFYFDRHHLWTALGAYLGWGLGDNTECHPKTLLNFPSKQKKSVPPRLSGCASGTTPLIFANKTKSQLFKDKDSCAPVANNLLLKIFFIFLSLLSEP